MNYQEIIKAHLDKLLGRIGQSSLQDKSIYFAFEDDFSQVNRTINQSNIIEQDLVDSFLKTVAEGRSWIHANLRHVDAENFLITIRVGEKVGNPSPSVNVSFDRNNSAKIITASK